MVRVSWDNVGERRFEVGVDRGVLYPFNSSGVPWNGLTSVTESPSGGESESYYADGVKYANVTNSEEFTGTIDAFTYPEEFEVCDGTIALRSGVTIGQQRRVPFNLSYRTRLGNDISGPDNGYKIHLVYNALASPSSKGYATISEDPEAITFSWSFTTTPVHAGIGYKRIAHLVINSTKVDALSLNVLEDLLYGTVASEPYFPTPAEVMNLFDNEGAFEVFLNGDTIYTAQGYGVTELSFGLFSLDDETVVDQNDGSFIIL